MESFLDREMASGHLKLAEKHVREGRRRVNAQRALVAKLEGDGHSVTQAERLLRLLEQVLALHVQHRDRLAERAKSI